MTHPDDEGDDEFPTPTEEEQLKTREWIEMFIVHLEIQEDRSAAITAVSMLEGMLSQALKYRLILNSRLRDQLFGGYGPLATFSAKIDLGYAVGLYNSDTNYDLHVIRRVRNHFAHSFQPRYFFHDDITKLCKSMRTLEVNGWKDLEPRRALMNTIWIFAWFFAHAGKIKIPRVKNDPRLPPSLSVVPFL
jgi:DNA-binding MltR family transcriptional regulator